MTKDIYLGDRVKAVCVERAIVDLIVGNVQGARNCNNPDMGFKRQVVTTPDYDRSIVERSQWEVTSRGKWPEVNRCKTK